MANCITDPLGCAASALGDAASDVATTAWDQVCQSFADAATDLFKAFGQAFTAIPSLNIDAAGLTGAYGISMKIGASVAALLVFGQVIRTMWTHDGSGLAQAAAGVAKMVLAWLLTVAVATAALQASDQLTDYIVSQTLGSQQAFAGRLASIVNWSAVTGQPGQAAVGASLLLVLALVGIVLVIVLWFELLLRNAAVAVLIAMSPLAAAGQASEATREWWPRTASATVQLIILKPVIALVFAVGFSMAGTSTGVEQVLSGLLILGLAVFSWPVIARFFTFASIQSTSGSGLAAALGFLTGAAAASGAGGGGTAGISPDQWSQSAETRTMAGRGGQGSPAASAGGAGTGTAGAPGTTGPAAAGGGAGAVLAGIGTVLQKAHQAGTQLAGRMEQTAAHGGMAGAYPYSTVPGGQRQAPGRPGRPDLGGSPPVQPAAPPAPDADAAEPAAPDPQTAPAPEPPTEGEL